MTEQAVRDWADQSGFLAKLDEEIELVSEGRKNIPDARGKIYEFLGQIGYLPPADLRGTILDFWNEKTLDMLIRINVDLVWGHEDWKRGTDKDVLGEFPASELIWQYREAPEEDWDKHWQECGGRLLGGKRIALKIDEIWRKISCFGLPHPPFELSGGLWVEDVDRDVAEKLGLIGCFDKMEAACCVFKKDLLWSLLLALKKSNLRISEI